MQIDHHNIKILAVRHWPYCCKLKRTEKQTGTTWAFTARQFAFGGATFVNRVIYIDGGYADGLLDLNLKRCSRWI